MTPARATSLRESKGNIIPICYLVCGFTLQDLIIHMKLCKVICMTVVGDLKVVCNITTAQMMNPVLCGFAIQIFMKRYKHLTYVTAMRGELKVVCNTVLN